VYATDLDGNARRHAWSRSSAPRGQLATGTADITDPTAVAGDVRRLHCRRFGGVDIVVPNAGIAHVSRLETHGRRKRVRQGARGQHHRHHARAARGGACCARSAPAAAIVVQASKNA
jgi:NAD(P)-dependent dehydrogenase (short-subunit alcohol dehydrogenase family)